MAQAKLSLNELRAVLTSTLEQLRGEKVGIEHCNAVSNIAGKYLKSYAIQMDYQRLTGAKRPITGLEDAE